MRDLDQPCSTALLAEGKYPTSRDRPVTLRAPSRQTATTVLRVAQTEACVPRYRSILSPVSAQTTFNMSTLRALAIVCFALALPFSIATAAQVFKCTIGGTVTYQASPCPPSQPRQGPTVEQLNAERQKKLLLAADSAGAQKAPTAGGQSPAAALTPAPTASPATARKCDGRTVCSQTTSCAEAKYFLANCPGTRMDGDGDGTPCEQQWCNK